MSKAEAMTADKARVGANAKYSKGTRLAATERIRLPTGAGTEYIETTPRCGTQRARSESK
jgi:hypothetical protein